MPRSFAQYQTGNALTSRLLIDEIIPARSSPPLSELLAKAPRSVTVLNHGPMLGGLTGLLGLNQSFMQSGGGERIPLGVGWRGFYKIPMLRQAIQYLTQADQPLDISELAERFRSGGFTDVVIMPEGDNCNFGASGAIKPFVSPGFIELALSINAPILIGVQKGGEAWGINVPLPSQIQPWLKKLLPESNYQCLQETRQFSLPSLLKGRLKQLTMGFDLYYPEISQAELSSRSTVRRGQLWQEANRVKDRMETMLAAMP